MLNDRQILMREELFREFNSWGLSYEELLWCNGERCCLERGNWKKDAAINGSDKKDWDTVYVKPNGSEMTRNACLNWISDWGPFVAGFNAAIENDV